MSSYARTEDEISKKFFHRELAGGLNWEKNVRTLSRALIPFVRTGLRDRH